MHLILWTVSFILHHASGLRGVLAVADIAHREPLLQIPTSCVLRVAVALDVKVILTPPCIFH